MPHVHGNLMEQLPMGSMPESSGNFEEVKAQVAGARLQGCQYCFTRNSMCRTTRPVSVDMSGLPCEDHSRANAKRMFFNGRNGKLFAVWAKMHKARGTPLLILENTPDTSLCLI